MCNHILKAFNCYSVDNHEAIEGETCSSAGLLKGNWTPLVQREKKNFMKFNIFGVVSGFMFLAMQLCLLMDIWENRVVGH